VARLLAPEMAMRSSEVAEESTIWVRPSRQARIGRWALTKEMWHQRGGLGRWCTTAAAGFFFCGASELYWTLLQLGMDGRDSEGVRAKLPMVGWSWQWAAMRWGTAPIANS
jgi:hypothetical protein